jgi:hypothetical protein
MQTFWLSHTSTELLTKIKSRLVALDIAEEKLAIKKAENKEVLIYSNVDFTKSAEFESRSETSRLMTHEHKESHRKSL